MKEKPDSGVYVKDLQSIIAKNLGEIEQVMTVGNKNRSVGATNMNEHSSRSHAIFIITIECLFRMRCNRQLLWSARTPFPELQCREQGK